MFKKLLASLQIAALLASGQAHAGLPPTTLGGVGETAKTTFNLKTPAAQSTQISGVTSLIETGNTNRLANPGLEGAVNWTAYADAAAASPVDGTAGAPTITCTRSTTAPLNGAAHLLVTKDAANRQGEGCSVPFTISRSDLSKSLNVSFNYEIKSGTYDAGSSTTDPDLTAWIYGPTDGTPALIQITPYKILGATSGTQMPFMGQFQTAASGVAYRLILHESKTGTSAYTIALDDFYTGPTRQSSYGAVQTDWQSFTPTGSWSANTTYTGFWRRRGDSIDLQYQLALAGAPTSATLTLNTPSGVTLDTTKLTSNNTFLQHGFVRGISAGNSFVGNVSLNNSTSLVATYILDGTTASIMKAGNVTQAAPYTFASADHIEVTVYNLPVVGWSSNVLMSSDADTRVMAFAASSATATVTGTQSDVSWTSVKDTHGCFNGTTTCTIPSPGYYDLDAQVRVDATFAAANYVELYLLINGSTDKVELDRASGAQTSMSVRVHKIKYLNAGDTVKIQIDSSATTPTITSGATLSSLSIFRLSGPAQIAASECVAVKYTNTAGTSITAANGDVPFATKVYDTHSAYNGTIFTAPMAGKYRLTARIRTQAVSNSTSQALELLVKVTSTPEGLSASDQQLAFHWGEGVSHIRNVSGSGTWQLNQGDTLTVRAANPNTIGLDTTAGVNYVQIERVGN